jgi:putative spermidine/putrescine transport system permease protein
VPAGTWALAPFVVLVVLPVALAFGTAVLYSVGAVGLVADGVSLDAWRRVLDRGEALGAFALSGAVATATVALALAVALPLALSLRRPIARGPLGAWLHAPLAIPAVVGAFVAYQLLTPSGIVGRWLVAAGLVDGMDGVPVVVNDRWAVGIVVAHVGLAVPFVTLLLVELYRSERVAQLGALARSLGASRRAVRWRVEVPVLLRGVAPQAMLLWVAVFGSYEIPLLLGRQSPQMVSVLTLRTFERYDLADKPEAFVLAVVYAVVVGGILALALRRRRVAS